MHDFASRGVSSRDSAAIGGLAHLIAFRGSDTGAALLAARCYYGCPMAGFSIPAAEHSTILAWGQENGLPDNLGSLRQAGSLTGGGFRLL